MKIILGVNIGHDSGASLLIDNKIVACINEERLSRKKMHIGFPFLAIDEVLSIGNVSIKNIDIVAVEGKLMAPISSISYDYKGDIRKWLVTKFSLDKFLLGTRIGILLTSILMLPNTLKQKLFLKKYFRSRGFRGLFKFYDHHHCHAASAFYSQPLLNGLTITLDASGEGYCSRVYKCIDGVMHEVHSICCYYSPAYYYAYITKILGFIPLRHEGKITGLAAYGDADKTLPILKKYITYSHKSLSFKNYGGYHESVLNKLTIELRDFSAKDIAAGVQKLTEQLVTRYISDCIAKFTSTKKCDVFLAGGLFANVKLNQKINELSNVNSLYIFPNMGDGGLNLGAALAYRQKNIELINIYQGRKYEDEDLEKIIIEKGLTYVKSDYIARDIAIAINENKIVARYAESMEYGPRSLGNRSILYSAKDKSINKWLNEKLNRTEFMPFAPAIRDIDIHKYFQVKNISKSFHHMTIACNVTKHCKKVASAIVHVDDTARPQVILKELNPTYYDIFNQYSQLTGEGIIVNTSFNLHEEPIVNTPEEAINTFISSKVDILAIGNFIVKQKINN